MKRYGKRADIRMGVIGYGPSFSIGWKHLSDAQKVGITPTAVAELDPERQAAAAKDFPGIKTFDSPKAMLKESGVNLVAVLTPHNSHAALAIECLNAGCHVVVEKPMAVNTAQCDAMIRTARQKGVMLSVYQSRHWDGSIMQAAKKINAGAVGEILRVEMRSGGRSQPRDWWRSSKSISGGILLDWGAHMLEYTFQFIKAPVVEVTGFAHHGFWAPKTRWKDDTIEDEASAVLRFADGRWARLTVTTLDMKPADGMLQITGTAGTYIMRGSDWTLIKPRGKGTVVITGPNPDSEWWRYYDNVAAHLTGGDDLVIPPELGRRIIHLLDLAGRSAVQGKSLKPKYA